VNASSGLRRCATAIGCREEWTRTSRATIPRRTGVARPPPAVEQRQDRRRRLRRVALDRAAESSPTSGDHSRSEFRKRALCPRGERPSAVHAKVPRPSREPGALPSGRQLCPEPLVSQCSATHAPACQARDQGPYSLFSSKTYAVDITIPEESGAEKTRVIAASDLSRSSGIAGFLLKTVAMAADMPYACRRKLQVLPSQ
jgi:hypothetical protein